MHLITIAEDSPTIGRPRHLEISDSVLHTLDAQTGGHGARYEAAHKLGNGNIETYALVGR